jgi:uncharacterized protein YdeI (BOF family)
MSVQGCDDALLARLGTLASWNALVALWQGGWLGAGKSSLRVSGAQVRARLRAIADARRSIAQVLSLPAGAAVCIEGTIIETTAEDLIVDDGSGELARARSETEWWHNPRVAPLPGDRVTIVGFADSEVDPTRAPDNPRALPRRVVIRAAGLPLIAHLGALALPTRAR